MIFWLILLAVFIAYPSKGKGICLFFFIVVGFICAIRYEIGYDYNNYMSFIKGTYDYDISYDRLEPLGKVLIELAVYFDFPQLFFIITSIIIYGSVAYFIRSESDDFKLSIIIFMSIPAFFWDSLSIIRQFLAVSCALMMFMCVYKGKIKTSIIFFILAILSHNSAYLLVLTYFAKYINFSKKIYVAIFIASFFLFFIMEILIVRYSDFAIFKQANLYILLKDNLSGGSKMIYLYDIIFILLLSLLPPKIFDNIKLRYYFNLFFIGVVVYNIFSVTPTMGIRMSGYFMPSLIVLIPYVVKYRFNHVKWEVKTVIYSCLIFIYIYTLQLAEITFQNNLSSQNPYCPYKTFLF